MACGCAFLALMAAAALASPSPPTRDQAAVRAFWSAFRQAAIARDVARVAALTQFPLQVKGETDDIPLRHVDRLHFKAVLIPALAADTGQDMQSHTELSLITATPKPPAMKPGQANCLGNFCFDWTRAGWRMVRIYTEN